MITKEKIKQEIQELESHGCMTSECIRDLTMLYWLQGQIPNADAEHDSETLDRETANYRKYIVKHPGHAESDVQPMTRERAQMWVKSMRKADNSTGEHWTYEQTSQVMKQRNIDCDPVEFYATMNMLWSDYGKVAERFGVSNVDYWAELAKAFLMDTDAEDDKLALYYSCIVKK